jgi:hypothetical protein
MYALILSVMLLNGETVDVQVPGEPMDAIQCAAEASNQIAQGFEVVRCKDLTAPVNSPDVIQLPSGAVVIMERAGVNSVSVTTPSGLPVIPDDLNKSDKAALMWSTKKFLSKVVDGEAFRF